ncbi:uncharacterized protein LOC129741903 [Uranotaenia lowii]|uniref:uncharacterized protein LOC129741903 n=1 Tax=Uranotaenia lowii TaxID=190385 RepID=UPI00247B1BD0|nr:uncharacterized protein LOC129741903 [Uranotaenia lowii]
MADQSTSSSRSESPDPMPESGQPQPSCGTRDTEIKLLATVRHCLEQGQFLRKTRCEMRRKVLDAIQGSGDNFFLGGQGQQQGQPPKAVQLINQMILEYFDWYNLQYSSEMFSVESGTARLERPIRREMLRSSLKAHLEDPLEFQSDLPILAELVMKMTLTGSDQES